VTKEDCKFCKLVEREGVVSSVYEDEKVMAFLDVKPLNEGHTLVIPKAHYENIYEIPEDEIAHVYKVVKRVALAVKRGVAAQGVSVTQHNERAALQRVFHLHVHVIPRYEGDRLATRAPYIVYDLQEVSRERLDATASKIKAYI